MANISKNTKYLIALSHFAKFGPVRIKKLKKYFHNNFELAFKADINKLISAGIDEKTAYEFIVERKKIYPDEIIEKLNREKIKIIKLGDDNYPALLSEIYDPPALLYCKGDLKKDECCVGIVGTRKVSAYGKQVTENFSSKLEESGLIIVSGMALGVDSFAHSTVLKSKGRTIAVLGTGIDDKSIYPRSNYYLSKKIVSEGGAVISEFPIGTLLLRYNFPQRNRIISGLSLGVLVIEAGERSGALITASCALDQNRDVFAVPGNIYSTVSIGPNNLIKQGAKLVSNADEILEFLNIEQTKSFSENKKILPENKEEKLIVNCLSHEAIHIDAITRQTNLPVNEVGSILIIMEMKGIIKNIGGMMYIRL